MLNNVLQGSQKNEHLEKGFSQKRGVFLERAAEATLVAAWQNCRDQRALITLLEHFHFWILQQIRPFRSFGHELDDLVAQARESFIYGLSKYSLSEGTRLSTYLKVYIRSGLLRYSLKERSAFSLSWTNTQRHVFFNLKKQKEALGLSGRALESAAAKKIADNLGAGINDVLFMESFMAQKVVGAEVLEESPPYETPDHSQDLEEAVLQENERAFRTGCLEKSLTKLKAVERRVLYRRFLGALPASLKEISLKEGLSIEGIRYIQSRAIEKVGKEMRRIEQASFSPAHAPQKRPMTRIPKIATGRTKGRPY